MLLLFLCSLRFLPIPGTPGAFPRPLPVVCGVVLGNDLRGCCLFSPLSLLFMFLAYLWHAWCLSHVEAIMVQLSQRYGSVAVRAESCVTATPTSESLPRPFGSICRRMDIASVCQPEYCSSEALSKPFAGCCPCVCQPGHCDSEVWSEAFCLCASVLPEPCSRAVGVGEPGSCSQRWSGPGSAQSRQKRARQMG